MSIKHTCKQGGGANIVDPVPIEAVWSGSTLFIYEASNSLVGAQNIHFVIMHFKG